MSKRRVVVTGLGAVTPIGNNVKDFWAGIRAGKVGIGPITKFDTQQHQNHQRAYHQTQHCGQIVAAGAYLPLTH